MQNWELEENWKNKAECSSLPWQWWFTKEKHESTETLVAKNICRRCPSQKQCLLFAIEQIDTQLQTNSREDLGIYGGMRVKDRKIYRDLDDNDRKLYLYEYNKAVKQRFLKSKRHIPPAHPHHSYLRAMVISLLENLRKTPFI